MAILIRSRKKSRLLSVKQEFALVVIYCIIGPFAFFLALYLLEKIRERGSNVNNPTQHVEIE